MFATTAQCHKTFHRGNLRPFYGNYERLSQKVYSKNKLSKLSQKEKVNWLF
jgi:hypothetical protein